jgi:hypothetical protein
MAASSADGGSCAPHRKAKIAKQMSNAWRFKIACSQR